MALTQLIVQYTLGAKHDDDTSSIAFKQHTISLALFFLSRIFARPSNIVFHGAPF